MKILVIDGAVNKNGDTKALLSEFLSYFEPCSEVSVETLGFSDNIFPCCDCRACETSSGCTISDKMTAMYDYILDCDLVVVASPVWYCCPSGICLNILSRFQTFFNAGKRNDKLKIKKKKSVILLAAGGSGGVQEAQRAIKIALSSLNVSKEDIYCISSQKTDNLAAKSDEYAKAKIKETVQKIKDSGI